MMTSQTNFGAALDPAASVHAQLAVKDEYTFAFLDLEDAHSERELERALTERIGAFSAGDGQYVCVCREPIQDSGLRA